MNKMYTLVNIIVQGFRVTCLYLLPQSLAWLLGFGAYHSLLFFVQSWHHHIETRQIQYFECTLGSNTALLVTEVDFQALHSNKTFAQPIDSFFKISVFFNRYTCNGSFRLQIYFEGF